MALCLQVKECEFIYIGEDIRISIAKHQGKKIRVWVEAPKEIKVLRQEAGDKAWAKKHSPPK